MIQTTSQTIKVHSRVWVTSDHDSQFAITSTYPPYEVYISHIEQHADRLTFSFNTAREYTSRHCVAGSFSVMRDGSRPRFRSVKPHGWTLADVLLD